MELLIPHINPNSWQSRTRHPKTSHQRLPQVQNHPSPRKTSKNSSIQNRILYHHYITNYICHFHHIALTKTFQWQIMQLNPYRTREKVILLNQTHTRPSPDIQNTSKNRPRTTSQNPFTILLLLKGFYQRATYLQEPSSSSIAYLQCSNPDQPPSALHAELPPHRSPSQQSSRTIKTKAKINPHKFAKREAKKTARKFVRIN
ncbi:uncharacterized protein G2W53_033434 [Senna tora]|uniref:Uncharacterized protein n=1 Tax=Senna tora TaxID=362788 RepID=A0A834SZ62_9FABA|nr:uncharacterized protein G2W53_033434 [Senna tora]